MRGAENRPYITVITSLAKPCCTPGSRTTQLALVRSGSAATALAFASRSMCVKWALISALVFDEALNDSRW